jgi:hypothetical protein
MRKRLLLMLGCVASLLLAGFVTLGLTAPKHRITRENFDDIREGMTEKEVEAILGARAGVYSSLCQTGVYPIGRCGDPVLGIDLGKSRGGKEWVTKAFSVYVLFDENGRVAKTYGGDGLLNENGSFLDKFRRWLGMWNGSAATEASPEEQQLAGLLIDAACQPICWPHYRDDTAEQLRALIQAKLQGRTLAIPVPEEVPILRLVDALKRSVAQALQAPSANTAVANQAVEAGLTPTSVCSPAARCSCQ